MSIGCRSIEALTGFNAHALKRTIKSSLGIPGKHNRVEAINPNQSSGIPQAFTDYRTRLNQESSSKVQLANLTSQAKANAGRAQVLSLGA